MVVSGGDDEVSGGDDEVSGGDDEVSGGDDEGTPLKALAGKYSSTADESYALCLDPTNNFAEISCADNKAKVFPQTEVDVEAERRMPRETRVRHTRELSRTNPRTLVPPLSSFFMLLAITRVLTRRQDRATGLLSPILAGTA
jgi:hypothetical protein